jgi:hypothetical protein
LGCLELIHPYFVLQSSEVVQELLLVRSINKRLKKKYGWLVFYIMIDSALWFCLPAVTFFYATYYS